MESPSWMIYISIVALLLFSAFFSMAETAISTFNRIRMGKQAQDGNKRAESTLEMAERYDKTLTTILIGNNIVNIAASTLATLVATALFGASGALISTVVMTLLVLIFGEILPKSYAKSHSDDVALQISGPLRFFIWLLTPLSFAFLRLNNAFSRVSEPAETGPTVTEEELMYMLESIEEEGVLEEQERELVQSALEFDETAIREIITPRVNVIAVDIEDSLEKITEVILEEGYSRIPVFENTIDNIIGILYTKEFLKHIIRGESIDLRGMLSEPYFVHKGMKLSQLLASLKARQINMAVVVDEYGGTMGVVTMEDLVEELVGEIWDEDDEIPDGLIQLDDDHFEVSGSYDVSALFEELGYEEEDLDTDYTTVSGWAMHVLEHIPEAGESFDYQDLHCTVLEMEGHLIGRLGLDRIAPDPEHEEN